MSAGSDEPQYAASVGGNHHKQEPRCECLFRRIVSVVFRAHLQFKKTEAAISSIWKWVTGGIRLELSQGYNCMGVRVDVAICCADREPYPQLVCQPVTWSSPGQQNESAGYPHRPTFFEPARDTLSQ